MNKRLLIRLPVVVLSLLLVGGYVYVRAGGNLAWKNAAGSTLAPDAHLPQQAVLPPDTIPVSSDTLLPGSKSKAVFMPSAGALPVANVEPAPAQPAPTPPTSPVVMGGSKSAAVFVPSNAAPAASVTRPAPPSGNSPEAPKAALIYGSKSAPVFLPSDGPAQPAPQQAKQQQPNQQAPPPKSADLNLPGSKSDRIFLPSDIPTPNQASGRR